MPVTYNKYPFKVIKPQLTSGAMCVYKMTFSNGCYYIGATSDFGDRISYHVRKLAKRNHTLIINKAFIGCKWVKFDFIQFINDKNKLNNREEFYISINIGKRRCLNQEEKCTTVFGNKKIRVVKLNLIGEIIETYPSICEAARSIGYSERGFRCSVNNGHKVKKMVFRFLDHNGDIIESIKLYKTPPTSRPVIQYDKDMNFIKRFESVTCAELEVKINKRTIWSVMNGKQKTTHGFIFRYAEPLKKVS